MKLMVIGDIHIGKKFNTYKPNQYSENIGNLREIWTNLTLEYIRESIDKTIDDLDAIIFLGDVYDSPSLRPELIHQFYSLLTFIRSRKSSIEIHIIVGNHDTTEPQNPAGNLLTIFNDIPNVYVYDKLTTINNNLIMFPYYKKEKLSDILADMVNLNMNNPVIFSHNDFYVNDTLIMTDMLPVDNIMLLFQDKVNFFNGHIHNFHYEPNNGVFFTGSVSPTSFKDSPMASGICQVDINDTTNEIESFKRYMNKKIVFITIDNEHYIDKLSEQLQRYRETKTKIVLRYYPRIRELINQRILPLYPDVVIYHKEHDANEDELIPVTNTQDIQHIQLKIKELTSKSITKEDVIEQLKKFMKKKHKVDITELSI